MQSNFQGQGHTQLFVSLQGDGAHQQILAPLQVMMCFEAVSNLSLVPFMCYKHPNGSFVAEITQIFLCKIPWDMKYGSNLVVLVEKSAASHLEVVFQKLTF